MKVNQPDNKSDRYIFAVKKLKNLPFAAKNISSLQKYFFYTNFIIVYFFGFSPFSIL